MADFSAELALIQEARNQNGEAEARERGVADDTAGALGVIGDMPNSLATLADVLDTQLTNLNAARALAEEARDNVNRADETGHFTESTNALALLEHVMETADGQSGIVTEAKEALVVLLARLDEVKLSLEQVHSAADETLSRPAAPRRTWPSSFSGSAEAEYGQRSAPGAPVRRCVGCGLPDAPGGQARELDERAQGAVHELAGRVRCHGHQQRPQLHQGPVQVAPRRAVPDLLGDVRWDDARTITTTTRWRTPSAGWTTSWASGSPSPATTRTRPSWTPWRPI